MTDRRTQRYARLHGKATGLPHRQAMTDAATLLNAAADAAASDYGWGGVLLTATRGTHGRWMPTLLRGRAADVSWLLGEMHTDASPTIGRTPLPGDDPAAVLEALGLLSGAHVFPTALPQVDHVLPVAFRMDLPPSSMDGWLLRASLGKVLAGPPSTTAARAALTELHYRHCGDHAALADASPDQFAVVMAYNWHTAGPGTAEAWECGLNGLPHRYGWAVADLLDDEPPSMTPPSAEFRPNEPLLA